MYIKLIVAYTCIYVLIGLEDYIQVNKTLVWGTELEFELDMLI